MKASEFLISYEQTYPEKSSVEGLFVAFNCFREASRQGVELSDENSGDLANMWALRARQLWEQIEGLDEESDALTRRSNAGEIIPPEEYAKLATRVIKMYRKAIDEQILIPKS
ncbi:hypothetical protein ACYFX5_08920 [Bremerella sp. T1]|uniref:hypothetical protein n=1 Tax=Bremerella sp. TYQ1 TaxID=3119568 RepID=UPI001CCDE530|nr:hypothetical protein [Bremerella volcania]UBM38376.1 hypothetical protein LA756_10850 [Bremerella volcania]